MAVLIDTSVLVQLERRRSTLAELRLDSEEATTAVATITVSEMLFGAHRATSEESRRKRLRLIDSLLDSVIILPLDIDIARRHARLHASLASSGQLVGAHDLIIAATAITHDLTLLTYDVRHFSRIAELSIMKPLIE